MDGRARRHEGREARAVAGRPNITNQVGFFFFFFFFFVFFVFFFFFFFFFFF